MRQTQMLWLFLMVCLFAGLAHGNSLPDPGVEIDDPSCVASASNTQTITAGQIDSFSSGNGSCFGFNISQSSARFNFIDLQVDAPIPFSSVTCFSPNYTCNATNLDNNSVLDVLFTAEQSCDGDCVSRAYIGGGPEFVVDLNFLQEFAQWGVHTFYIRGSDTASTPADNPNLIQQFNAPEPSSFALLGTGAAAIVARRKMLKRKTG